MSGDRLLTLVKDGLLGTGFMVAKIDFGLVFELFQIVGKGSGAVMAGLLAQFQVIIGKSGFDDKRIQAPQLIQDRPEGVIS